MSPIYFKKDFLLIDGSSIKRKFKRGEKFWLDIDVISGNWYITDKDSYVLMLTSDLEDCLCSKSELRQIQLNLLV